MTVTALNENTCAPGKERLRAEHDLFLHLEHAPTAPLERKAMAEH